MDTSTPGETPSFAIDPLVAPYSANATLGQTEPVLVRAGTRLYVAWRSERVLGAPEGEELWLKELVWGAGEAGLTLDLSKPEIPLPRWSAHRPMDQRRPSLTAMPLWPEGAIAVAWEDWGVTFGFEGEPDVVTELIPTPVLRIPLLDGGAQ